MQLRLMVCKKSSYVEVLRALVEAESVAETQHSGHLGSLIV